ALTYLGSLVEGISDPLKYALVAGASLKYLWILSRETTITDEVKQHYLHIANTLGYKTADLIWVVHDSN
ncbi:MAG: lipocalin family protein, partial [Ferruginibacter sp.]|nr:lipocalin family protein [Chitinophagaceae bacterium]